MEDELSPPKSSHKEELNLNFVPAIRTTYTGYGNRKFNFSINKYCNRLFSLCNMPHHRYITVINILTPIIPIYTDQFPGIFYIWQF